MTQVSDSLLQILSGALCRRKRSPKAIRSCASGQRVALRAPPQSRGEDAEAKTGKAKIPRQRARHTWLYSPLEMDFDPARGFAPRPGVAGGGGAIDSFAPAHSAWRLAHLCRSIPIGSIHQSKWAAHRRQFVILGKKRPAFMSAPIPAQVLRSGCHHSLLTGWRNRL